MVGKGLKIVCGGGLATDNDYIWEVTVIYLLLSCHQDQCQPLLQSGGSPFCPTPLQLHSALEFPGRHFWREGGREGRREGGREGGKEGGREEGGQRGREVS